MIKHMIGTAAALALSSAVFSQPTFFGKVSIEYAKTVAVWPLMKEMEPDWFEQAKDNMPKETISYFTFTGDSSHSIYKKTKDAEIPRGMWFQPFADDNVVYNDYTSHSTITQKPIYEETYLMQDSLLHIRWKITPDTRTIAGFNCHKAIGILYDSISVFAFYTDEILITGGPEGIQGLPGMILGIGIPRLHTTWFATKVNVSSVDMKPVTPAVKGKKTSRHDMLATLNNAMKKWDEYGQKMMLAFII